MPTASTAQIMGNNECFEPYTSNLYNRRVMAGDFPVINPHLIKDLIAQDLWSLEMKHKIMAHDGSVQCIPEIPADTRALYMYPDVLVLVHCYRPAWCIHANTIHSRAQC